MTEIQTPIVANEDGSFTITDEHTVTDVARWAFEQGWLEDLVVIGSDIVADHTEDITA